MATTEPESGELSQAAAAYLRVAPTRAAAAVVERLAQGASEADEADRALAAITPDGRTIDQVNVLLAALYRLLVEPGRDPGDPSGERPVLVGVLDDSSIISSARTYEDGSSLILVPTGAIDLCEAMSSCVAVLLSAAFDLGGPGDRRHDLTTVAFATVMDTINQIQDHFHADRLELTTLPALDPELKDVIDLVQGLFRFYLVIRRTWNIDPGMPLRLGVEDEYVGRQLGRLSLAFVLAHELAHLQLGHVPLPGHQEPVGPEQARQQELDADETAVRLVAEVAVTAYGMSPPLADSFARLAGIIALGMNWFYESGLMIRGSGLHPGPEARIISALLGALEAAEIELVAVLIFGVTMRAGLTFVPLPEETWDTVLEHPESAVQDVLDASLDLLDDAATPEEAAGMSMGLNMLLDVPMLDSSMGIPLERFRTLVRRSSDLGASFGEVVDIALRHIDAGDTRAALETLGVRPARIEAIVDTTRTLSFFGLVQAILNGEAFARCPLDPPTRHAVAAQLSHYLTKPLSGEHRDDLSRFHHPTDGDEPVRGPKG
uniref:hypothetical protein n=1 Tax=Nonomuraea sp. CA-252377 TaxID=3240003 RepID=UPI003F49787B